MNVVVCMLSHILYVYELYCILQQPSCLRSDLHTLLSLPSAEMRSAHSLEYSKFLRALSTAATQFLYLESLSSSTSSAFILLGGYYANVQLQAHIDTSHLHWKTKQEGTEDQKPTLIISKGLVIFTLPEPINQYMDDISEQHGPIYEEEQSLTLAAIKSVFFPCPKIIEEKISL